LNITSIFSTGLKVINIAFYLQRLGLWL